MMPDFAPRERFAERPREAQIVQRYTNWFARLGQLPKKAHIRGIFPVARLWHLGPYREDTDIHAYQSLPYAKRHPAR
jgi:hypothetical protein